MKVAVIGAEGQLGSDVVAAFDRYGDQVYPLPHREVDLTRLESVRSVLERLRPHLTINAAAMHHVERCEEDPQQAFAVNAFGARNLALVTKELDSVLMHVSTDYVFDGTQACPYVEEDAPRPLNVYGVTKLAGEYFVRCTNQRHFVLRTSGLYGRNPCRAKGGLNFVELMLKLGRERRDVAVVDDEFITPTCTTDLALQMVVLSRSDYYGLYHATSEGSCSWHEFAHEIFRIANISIHLKAASPEEFPTRVVRPKYSVLENQALKLRALNAFKSWRHALQEYLNHRFESNPGQVSG
jgi:dTDP-4-dehydrorhamnose reductase